ncbi:MAG: LacI family DNA-binding transcriptional regulator [Clostridia bacterium]|nr:LacI family DNA-binding transcriptional regulator [Clostridia bacterium]
MSKRVTIKDVATEAGVSVTTVSFVLNGKGGGVSQSTKERIFCAAEKLRYTPNHTARSLVMGRTNMIGVIVPSITNTFFAELVRNLQRRFAKQGYDIILSNNEESARKDLKSIDLLAGRNIDGIMLTPSAESLSPENIGLLKEAIGKLSVPCLFLDRYVHGYPHVSLDNSASAYSLTDYLVSRGHTKIGVVTGPMQLNSSANRLKGLRKRLSESGLTLCESCLFEGQYDLETGERAAEYFLQTDVTAVVAFSDIQAYGIYKRLKECGKRVPEDLSVVGIDDNVYSALLDRPLTTMRQPIAELADAAVMRLVQMMNGEELSPLPKMQAQLVERESVKLLHGKAEEEE